MSSDPDPSIARPWLSIVLPMRNEGANVAFVTEAILRACAPHAPFEIICVDDGSSDDTVTRVRGASSEHSVIRLVRHDRPAGQSAAIHTGVLAARGLVICTLDGDGQNPPAEIPRLLAHLDGRTFSAGVGLVAGQRVGRRDTLSKRLASHAANAIRATALRDHTRDTGCGLKLFARDAFLALPYFDHMHRYLPALFARDGWAVLHQDVAHAPRHAGRSNYANLGRAVAGFWDLMGVVWLIRRAKKAQGREEGDVA